MATLSCPYCIIPKKFISSNDNYLLCKFHLHRTDKEIGCTCKYCIAKKMVNIEDIPPVETRHNIINSYEYMIDSLRKDNFYKFNEEVTSSVKSNEDIKVIKSVKANEEVTNSVKSNEEVIKSVKSKTSDDEIEISDNYSEIDILSNDVISEIEFSEDIECSDNEKDDEMPMIYID